MNGTGTYTPARLAKMIDQTLLKAYATREDFRMESTCSESHMLSGIAGSRNMYERNESMMKRMASVSDTTRSIFPFMPR